MSHDTDYEAWEESPPSPVKARIGGRKPGSTGRHAAFRPDEDQELLRLLQRFPPGTSQLWSKVSSLLPNRTGKQCRDRYINHLRPLDLTPLTADQEEELLRLLPSFTGPHHCVQWTQLVRASTFSGKSVERVKNKYRRKVKALLRKGTIQPATSLLSAPAPAWQRQWRSPAPVSQQARAWPAPPQHYAFPMQPQRYAPRTWSTPAWSAPTAFPPHHMHASRAAMGQHPPHHYMVAPAPGAQAAPKRRRVTHTPQYPKGQQCVGVGCVAFFGEAPAVTIAGHSHLLPLAIGKVSPAAMHKPPLATHTPNPPAAGSASTPVGDVGRHGILVSSLVSTRGTKRPRSGQTAKFAV